MLFGKNKQQQTRGFTYKPRFWDEKKEEFDNRIAEAKRRHHGESDGEYRASGSFNFRSRHAAPHTDPRFDTSYGKAKPMRILALIVLLGAIVFIMLYFQN